MLPLLLRVVGGFVARNKTATAVAANYTIGMFQDNSPKINPLKKNDLSYQHKKLIEDSKPIFDTRLYGTRREIPRNVTLRNQVLQKMVNSPYNNLTERSSILRGLLH